MSSGEPVGDFDRLTEVIQLDLHDQSLAFRPDPDRTVQAGLELLGTNGRWYPVPCDPGSLAVNAGEMLDLALTQLHALSTAKDLSDVAAKTAEFTAKVTEKANSIPTN